MGSESETLYKQLWDFTGLTRTWSAWEAARDQFHLESPFARKTAGFIMLFMNFWHMSPDNQEIKDAKKNIVAVGPHRSSLDGPAVASRITGTIPSFFVTNGFDRIPGVKRFLDMFQVIKVNFDGDKSESLREGARILKKDGCVVMLPEGDFRTEDPLRIQNGASKLALADVEGVENPEPVMIQVIRPDGFDSLKNPFIPVFLRDSAIYRAFLMALHKNNIRLTCCRVIDFHLKKENAHLSTEEKKFEINAQLYAYFRHFQCLTPKEIEAIDIEIEHGTHRLIWQNKLERDAIPKKLKALEKEDAVLAKETKKEGAMHYLLDDTFFANGQEKKALKQKLAILEKENEELEATSFYERTHERAPFLGAAKRE
jgi:1-acyl-sn-glycerol-3-phosphate acyltransferase